MINQGVVATPNVGIIKAFLMTLWFFFFGVLNTIKTGSIEIELNLELFI